MAGEKKSYAVGLFFVEEIIFMKEGMLYFIKDEFYEKYSEFDLLYNKEQIGKQEHNRPCCYLFKYSESNIYWMIPISSKIEKYQREYENAIKKYGMCDNISFGYVLGRKCAFLPQNMFPITEKYILNVYKDSSTGKPVKLDEKLIRELNKKARKKIRFNMKGKKLGMTDIVGILARIEANQH